MSAHTAAILAPVFVAVLAAAVPVIRGVLRNRTEKIVRVLAPAGSGDRLLLPCGHAVAAYRDGRAAVVFGGSIVVILCWALIWAIVTIADPAHHSWQFACVVVAVAMAVWFAAVVPVLDAACDLSVAIAPATGSLRLARLVSSGMLPLATLVIIIAPSATYL